MRLSPPVAGAAVGSKAVVLLLLTFCLLLLPLWESVIVLCFVVCYFMSVLVLQSSWWGRESWLLCLICLPGVSWWLRGSSSRCQGVVCSLWLWYFLIILTYYFLRKWDSKPVYLATATGWKTEILLVTSLDRILSKKRITITKCRPVCVGAQAGMLLCCSQTQKTGL